MRTTAIVFGALLCLATSPSVRAGDGPGHGNHGHGNHGHGNHGHGGGGGGGGGGAKTKIQGAGQRLHFSFGGKVKFQQGKVTGHFAIISHPLAPESSTRLVVSCRYNDFWNASLAGPRLEFSGKGKCKVLETDGDIDEIDVKNRFVIVDNPAGADQIDVEFIGATGIMIPGGELAFGNFTFTQG